MKRTATSPLLAVLMILSVAAPAFACAGLVAPNGSVRLLRTATLAGYHDGVEHYVTSFQFQGGGAKFGSIVPLPGVPSRVTRGGDWTLQRLEIETQPPPPVPLGASGGSGSRDSAKELYETEIDGLLITILKGGSRAVGQWAKDEGFALTPDAPEVLRFYAQRSKIFMAARFIPKKSQDKQVGDGIPIHLRIPTDNPWVPLRILALGKKDPRTDVTADVYLLTHGEPTLLPAPEPAGNRGMSLEHNADASKDLLSDLRSDKGMKWIPAKMWLTYLRIDINAGKLLFDLSVGTDARGGPYEEEAYGAQPDDGSSQPTPSPSPTSSLLGLILVPLFGFGALRTIRKGSLRDR
ncbi:MAG: hypothetical protein QOG16_1104 [Actinomycetota bacterium]|jgi:hypothetical protein|nr:hypothetical protein [Actinomycetota bacterium]